MTGLCPTVTVRYIVMIGLHTYRGHSRGPALTLTLTLTPLSWTHTLVVDAGTITRTVTLPTPPD